MDKTSIGQNDTLSVEATSQRKLVKMILLTLAILCDL